MSLSNHTIIALQDALTLVSAGNELANATQTGAVLSKDTTSRLQDAMTNVQVASDIQACIEGTQALSFMDIEYIADGLANYEAAGNFIANLAGGISPSVVPMLPQLLPVVPASYIPIMKAVSVSMPSGFSIVNSYVGNSAVKQVQVTFPAGSTFPYTGAGDSWRISNAGNVNTYSIWYNVAGSSSPVTVGQAATAQGDAQTAYTNLNGMTATPISATLDGQTLTPGVYSAGAPHLATSGAAALTFNGAGVYVIQCASTLTTGAGGVPTMTLTGGATAANIYWVVGSSATINSGTAGTFQGNVIAYASITDTLGGTVNGSLIALNGAVTLSAASIVNAENAPLLGYAGTFGLLGASGVTNTGSSVITGNVGSSPTDSITGFPPGTIVGVGANTNPTPAGMISVEVNISPSDSAAQIASETEAAMAAVVVGMNESVSGAVLTVQVNPTLNQIQAITFSPKAGSYVGTQVVTISSVTAGASFYYTTDGSTPTTSSTHYTAPISVASSETVKVLATKLAWSNSAIASAAYVIS